jgi:hypothetical protein
VFIRKQRTFLLVSISIWDNIKINLKELALGVWVVDWIHLAQNRDQWLALVYVMTLPVL